MIPVDGVRVNRNYSYSIPSISIRDKNNNKKMNDERRETNGLVQPDEKTKSSLFLSHNVFVQAFIAIVVQAFIIVFILSIFIVMPYKDNDSRSIIQKEIQWNENRTYIDLLQHQHHITQKDVDSSTTTTTNWMTAFNDDDAIMDDDSLPSNKSSIVLGTSPLEVVSTISILVPTPSATPAETAVIVRQANESEMFVIQKRIVRSILIEAVTLALCQITVVGIAPAVASKLLLLSNVRRNSVRWGMLLKWKRVFTTSIPTSIRYVSLRITKLSTKIYNGMISFYSKTGASKIVTRGKKMIKMFLHFNHHDDDHDHDSEDIHHDYEKNHHDHENTNNNSLPQ